jgi:hypothetical protein
MHKRAILIENISLGLNNLVFLLLVRANLIGIKFQVYVDKNNSKHYQYSNRFPSIQAILKAKNYFLLKLIIIINHLNVTCD